MSIDIIATGARLGAEIRGINGNGGRDREQAERRTTHSHNSPLKPWRNRAAGDTRGRPHFEVKPSTRSLFAKVKLLQAAPWAPGRPEGWRARTQGERLKQGQGAGLAPPPFPLVADEPERGGSQERRQS